MPLWEHNGHVHVEDIWKTDSGWNVLMSRKFQALLTNALAKFDVDSLASKGKLSLLFGTPLREYASLAIEPLLSDATLKASLASSVMSALVMDRVSFLLSLPAVVIDFLFEDRILDGQGMEVLWYMLEGDTEEISQCRELMVRALVKHRPDDDSVSSGFLDDLDRLYLCCDWFTFDWRREQRLRILSKEANDQAVAAANYVRQQEKLRQENELNKKLTQILDSMRISLSD